MEVKWKTCYGSYLVNVAVLLRIQHSESRTNTPTVPSVQLTLQNVLLTLEH